jgi:hypothetical protein
MQKADPLTPTIFHEPWWLNVATEGRCEAVEVVHGGKLVGRMPYQLYSNFGVKRGVMPHLTHFLGPAIDAGDGSFDKRFHKRLAITKELIAKLPPLALFEIKCHRGMREVVAFQAANFRIGVQFTNEILPQPVERIWQSMTRKKRSDIVRAQSRLTVSPSLDPAEFATAYCRNLESRGKKNTLPMAMCLKLIAACISRGRGGLFAARGRQGELEAGIFCVWDDTASHYLLTTRRENAHSGAVSLLLWEAVQDAVRRGLIFDFDGLPNEGGVAFTTSFGATFSPRFIVTRQSAVMKAYRCLRSFIRTENCFQ